MKYGELVDVWPTDTGFSRKDRGRLVALTPQEAVIEGKADGGVDVRFHFPRTGYRVRKVGGPSL